MNRDLSLQSHIIRLMRAIRRSPTTNTSRMLVSVVENRLLQLHFRWTARFQSRSSSAGHECRSENHFPSPKNDHISDVLQDLHWLRVPQRIKFKLYLYKALHNLAPSYLAELCIPVTAVIARQWLHSSSAGNLVVPKPRSEFGMRAFAFAELHAWNNLPQTMKSSTSVAIFKKQLKIHLFR